MPQNLPAEIGTPAGTIPPPVVERVTAYAHCSLPAWECATESAQFEVEAIRKTHYRRIGDLDGDWQSPFAHMVERSWEVLEFANENDRLCGCGAGRKLSGEKRPVYPNLSGYDQHRLVQIRRGYTIDDLKPPRERRIEGAVFQSAQPAPGSPEFADAVAEAVAAALAAHGITNGNSSPAPSGVGAGEDDPHAAAVLAAYDKAGGSSGKAAEALRGTEHECSERTVRNIVRRAGR